MPSGHVIVKRVPNNPSLFWMLPICLFNVSQFPLQADYFLPFDKVQFEQLAALAPLLPVKSKQHNTARYKDTNDDK